MEKAVDNEIASLSDALVVATHRSVTSEMTLSRHAARVVQLAAT